MVAVSTMRVEGFRPEIILGDPEMAGVRVELTTTALWEEFNAETSEMIVTKHGRRLFPDLQFRITGLDSSAYYFVLLDMKSLDGFRHRFFGTSWMPSTKTDSPQTGPQFYTHENSPALGSDWQAKPISFNKVRVTNTVGHGSDHLLLNSMHRYVPRLHVFKGSDIALVDQKRFTTFVFPQTAFVATTAYQNPRIVALKVKHNPFAGGFRDSKDRKSLKRSLSDRKDSSSKRRAGSASSRSEVSSPASSSRSSVDSIVPLDQMQEPGAAPVFPGPGAADFAQFADHSAPAPSTVFYPGPQPSVVFGCSPPSQFALPAPAKMADPTQVDPPSARDNLFRPYLDPTPTKSEFNGWSPARLAELQYEQKMQPTTDVHSQQAEFGGWSPANSVDHSLSWGPTYSLPAPPFAYFPTPTVFQQTQQHAQMPYQQIIFDPQVAFWPQTTFSGFGQTSCAS